MRGTIGFDKMDADVGVCASNAANYYAAWAEEDALGLLQVQLQVQQHQANSKNILSPQQFSQSSFSIKGNSHVSVRRQLALAVQSGAYKDDDIAAYRTQYLSEMQARQAVYYLHVSKTAGTFLCDCGWLSGCKSFDKKNHTTCTLALDKTTPGGFGCGNCHAPFNWPAWTPRMMENTSLGVRNSALDTCAGTAEFLRYHNITVEGNERYLISEGLCPQFWNIMVLRSPQERLVSHLSMISEMFANQYFLPVNASLNDVNREIPGIANNFFIRSLLGKDVYELPLGQITTTHLEQAKRVLEEFDLVFVQSDTLAQRLKSRMGWSCPTAPSREGTTDAYLTHLKQVWTPAEWEQLDENNKLDELLLNHARTLEEADQAVFDHPVFASDSMAPQHLCKAPELTGVGTQVSLHQTTSPTSPHTVLVHIPKTAGTALMESFEALENMIGVSMHSCGVLSEQLRACLPTTQQSAPILAGEFVSTEFLSLLEEPELSAGTNIWTVMRNPVMRTLSQLEHHRRGHCFDQETAADILVSNTCPLGSDFCNSLGNPKKCMNDACNIFANHQSNVLGFNEESRHPFDLAKDRLQTSKIHVGITEYYQATICLFLHENQHLHASMNEAFDQCCSEPDAPCSLIDTANVHGTDANYWNLYLEKPEIRSAVLERTTEDCALYLIALTSFEKRVRAMEAARGVTVIPQAQNLTSWSCKSWLDEFASEFSAGKANLVSFPKPYMPWPGYENAVELDWDDWEDLPQIAALTVEAGARAGCKH
jgi:hypothetical protein